MPGGNTTSLSFLPSRGRSIWKRNNPSLKGMLADYDNAAGYTGYGIPPPARKRKSKSQGQATVNGTKSDEKTEPEEPVDTSKLEIKFVDQTWDIKKVSIIIFSILHTITPALQ